MIVLAYRAVWLGRGGFLSVGRCASGRPGPAFASVRRGRRERRVRLPYRPRYQASSSGSVRSFTRARETELLTVPTETPSNWAVCTSVRSS